MCIGTFFMCSGDKVENRRVLWEVLEKSRQRIIVQLDICMRKKKHIKMQLTMVSHYAHLGRTWSMKTCFSSAGCAFKSGILEKLCSEG